MSWTVIAVVLVWSLIGLTSFMFMGGEPTSRRVLLYAACCGPLVWAFCLFLVMQTKIEKWLTKED